MWDYATGKPFQHIKDIPHPGSLDAESGVFVSTFDKTGTRLITGGADKTIKVCFFLLPLPSFFCSRLTLGNRFLCYSCRSTLSSRELALVLSQDGIGSGREWFGGSGRVQYSKWCSVWINQCASNTVLLVTADRVVLARERVHVDLLCTRGGEKRVSQSMLV